MGNSRIAQLIRAASIIDPRAKIAAEILLQLLPTLRNDDKQIAEKIEKRIIELLEKLTDRNLTITERWETEVRLHETLGYLI